METKCNWIGTEAFVAGSKDKTRLQEVLTNFTYIEKSPSSSRVELQSPVRFESATRPRHNHVIMSTLRC